MLTSARIFILLLLLIGRFAAGFAQANSSDCGSARAIKVPGTYHTEGAPAGFGELQEMKGGKKNKMALEKEHHSHWYKFKVPYSGLLSLEIIPDQPRDDYDFLLYKAENVGICEGILSKNAQPVRSNISRTGRGQNDGRTGLIDTVPQAFVASGPGEAWSKSVAVRQGEVYFLLLDNVYENGAGYTLNLELERILLISGKVSSDVAGTPMVASIALTDRKTGRVVDRTTTGEDGEYSLALHTEPNRVYDLIVQADSHFFYMKPIRVNSLRNPELPGMNFTLQKLEFDKIFPLHNINFVENEPTFLPEAYPTLRALHWFMERNPNLNVRLEGHINVAGLGDFSLDPLNGHALSNRRASAVVNYLKKRGISRQRIEAEGFGGTRMLYPFAESEFEMKENRRVEVRMAGWKGEKRMIDWEEGNLEALFQRTNAERKPVLVNVTKAGSKPCRYMDQRVWTDSYMQKALEQNFLLYSLKASDLSAAEYLKKYEVNTFPTLLFFSPEGELLHRQEGQLGSRELEDLSLAVMEMDNIETRIIDPSIPRRDKLKLFHSLMILGKSPSFEVLEAYLEPLEEEDRFSMIHLVMLTRFHRPIDGPVMEFVWEHRKEFEANTNALTIQYYLMEVYKDKGALEAARLQDEALLAKLKERVLGLGGYQFDLREMDMVFYSETGNAERYVEVATEHLKTVGGNWNNWYHCALQAQKLGGESNLSLARKWVEESVALRATSQNLELAIAICRDQKDFRAALVHLESLKKEETRLGANPEEFERMALALRREMRTD